MTNRKEGGAVVSTVPSMPAERLHDDVCILGFTDHRELVHKHVDTAEIWGINELYRYMDVKIFTRWFEIHKREVIDPDEKHIKEMGELPLAVYMQEHYEDIPNSVPFPKTDVEKACGHIGMEGDWEPNDYFTNSISWMIGMAICLGFKRMFIYGVDMAQETEYCSAPETLVLSADLRWKCAGDIKVGERLIAFDEHRGVGTSAVAKQRRALAAVGAGDVQEEWQPSEKDKCLPNAARQWRVATVEKTNLVVRPTYRIRLADGTELVSSAEHRWLVFAENHQICWRETQDLVKAPRCDARPVNLVRILDTWEHDSSWEAGYLSAAFDGEGFLTQHKLSHSNSCAFSIGFSQKENVMADKVRYALECLAFPWSEYEGKDVTNFYIRGGRSESMRFLGLVRPERLLGRFDATKLGQMQTIEHVPIEQLEYLGEQELVALKTSEGTFVAEGFASHNSEQRPNCEYIIGLARGQGIKVFVPPTSDLLKSIGQYGFGTEGNLFLSKLVERMTWLQSEIQKADQNVNLLEQQYTDAKTKLDGQYKEKNTMLTTQKYQLEGAHQDCTFWKRSWALPNEASAEGPTPDRSADPKTGITKEELPVSTEAKEEAPKLTAV